MREKPNRKSEKRTEGSLRIMPADIDGRGDRPARKIEEKDSKNWIDKLKIIGIDLRDIQEVLKMVHYIKKNTNHIDILINNAAQTIQKVRIIILTIEIIVRIIVIIEVVIILIII